MLKRGNNIIIAALVFSIIAISMITTKNSGSLEPLYPISNFSFLNQDSNIFTSEDLKDKVSVIDFFFTRCEGPCPAMNRYMKQLAEKYSYNDALQFISFSVDPSNDTIEVIKDYVDSGYLNYKSWHFLQTDSLTIKRLLENDFKLSADGLPGMHSMEFILADSNGNIIGYYNPFLETEFDLLKSHINYLLDTI